MSEGVARLSSLAERAALGADVEPTTARDTSEPAPESDQLASVAETLRASTPRPDPAVAAEARRRFLESAALRAASRVAAQRRDVARVASSGGRRRASFVAAPIVLMFAVALGSYRATAQSLPDNPMYAVKLTIERGVQLLPASHGARALRALGYARRRLREVDQSLGAGKSPAVVTSALDHFKADIFVASTEAGAMSMAEAAPSRADVIVAINREVDALESRQASLSDAGISSVQSIEDAVDRRVASLTIVGSGRGMPADDSTAMASPTAPVPAIAQAFSTIALELRTAPSPAPAAPPGPAPTPAGLASPEPPAPQRVDAPWPSPTAPDVAPPATSRERAHNEDAVSRPSVTPGVAQRVATAGATATPRAPVAGFRALSSATAAFAPRARRSPSPRPSGGPAQRTR